MHRIAHPFCWGGSDQHKAAGAPPAPGLLRTLPVLLPTKCCPEMSVLECGPFDKRKTMSRCLSSLPSLKWTYHQTSIAHTHAHMHTHSSCTDTYTDTLHISSHTHKFINNHKCNVIIPTVPHIHILTYTYPHSRCIYTQTWHSYTFIYYTYSFSRDSLSTRLLSTKVLAFVEFFWPHWEAYSILVPQPGIESMPSAVELQSLNTGSPRKSYLHGIYLPSREGYKTNKPI